MLGFNGTENNLNSKRIGLQSPSPKKGISRKWEKKWENSDALADLIEDCGISTDATPVLKGSNKKVKMKNFGVQCR